MLPRRIILLLTISALPCLSTESAPDPPPESKTLQRGKAFIIMSYGYQSRLDHFGPDDLKKTAELDAPVTVTVLSVGRSVAGLEEIRNGIIDVRIVNPNPYPIFVQGRQYKENKTIILRWNTLKGNVWTLAGFDWCGTGVRDWDIKPNGSIDVMLHLHPKLKQQQILGRFYRIDRPSIQSDCLLYEKK